MMKTVVSFFILLSFAFLGSCSGSGNYADGVYTGKAVGNGGKMTVEVTIASGKIDKISVLESSESPEMVAAVEGTLIPQIIDNQGTENVDTVSGASNTSKAVLSAVSEILEKHPRQ